MSSSINSFNKSDLILQMERKFSYLNQETVVEAVDILLQEIINHAALDQRIEIRGFGSFCLHYRAPRTGRNPKTGDSVELAEKYVPHFKPGKELRDQVNDSL